MTRAERAAKAARLRGQGLVYREIAERMGISLSYARDLVRDPDGSLVRERKDSYRGTCVDCGKRTDGSNGRSGAPDRCFACTNIAKRLWTKETIVAAMQRFAKRYGRPPAAPDFNPSQAISREQSWRVERFHKDDDYPFVATVLKRFGSWNAAIEAAGFVAVAVGKWQRSPGTHRAPYLIDEEAA